MSKEKKNQNVLRRQPECGWSRDQIRQFQASRDEHQTILGFPPSRHEASTFAPNQFVIWKLLRLLTFSDPAPSFSSTLPVISSYVQHCGCSPDASFISLSFSMHFSEPVWPSHNALIPTRWLDGAHLLSYRTPLMWPTGVYYSSLKKLLSSKSDIISQKLFTIALLHNPNLWPSRHLPDYAVPSSYLLQPP